MDGPASLVEADDLAGAGLQRSLRFGEVVLAHDQVRLLDAGNGGGEAFLIEDEGDDVAGGGTDEAFLVEGETRQADHAVPAGLAGGRNQEVGGVDAVRLADHDAVGVPLALVQTGGNLLEVGRRLRRVGEGELAELQKMLAGDDETGAEGGLRDLGLDRGGGRFRLLLGRRLEAVGGGREGRNQRKAENEEEGLDGLHDTDGLVWFGLPLGVWVLNGSVVRVHGRNPLY